MPSLVEIIIVVLEKMNMLKVFDNVIEDNERQQAHFDKKSSLIRPSSLVS